MITIRNLRKSFGQNEVLRGVDLEVPRGKVTAFLGPNGAGKTTTIKCAMNLVEWKEGQVDVLGSDARKLQPKHWQKIGYVSENQQMPDGMTVPELLDYVRPLYGALWDREFEKKMLAEFDLPLKVRLKSLSRGQRMKASLLSSLAYRPELVVLDEPFSGLDPLVRDEFLNGLLELTEKEGWTVWVSSHDIEEVERFADRVVVLNGGQVDLEESVDSLQQRFRAVEVTFEDEVVQPERLLENWMGLKVSGRRLNFVDGGYEEGRSQAQWREVYSLASNFHEKPMALREIFVALARKYRLSDQSNSEK